MIIGCDVDGVLCDFRAGYAELLRRLQLSPVIANHVGPIPPSAHAAIRASDDWWTRLPQLRTAGVALHTLSAQQGCYFLTSRFGPRVQAQTAAWLVAHGYRGSPSVIVVQKDLQKSTMAELLGCDRLIDDTARCGSQLPSTIAFYLVNRPWNQDATLRRGQRRVDDVLDALP